MDGVRGPGREPQLWGPSGQNRPGPRRARWMQALQSGVGTRVLGPALPFPCCHYPRWACFP